MDANNVRKRINIARGNALTVQALKDYLDTLDPKLEVCVLLPRAGLKTEIYPPRYYRVTSMSVEPDWEMLDLRIEEVLDDGE